MSRLPIRLRLALSFTAAAAVLLTAVGAFGYQRLAAGSSQALDLELRQRAQDLIGPVSTPGASLTALAGTGFVERGESFAEVITPRGRLLEATPTLDGRPLLSPDQAATGARHTVTFDRSSAPGLDEPARLLATPFTRSGHPLVLVVGDTRENGLEDLRRVRDQLLVGIPLLVLLTFLGAYAVAGAALRPVEAMRRRAAELTAADPALRLPVPDGGDELTRLGKTLNELLARVEATLERERSFVAHASHELRTPLALLRTELELAVRRPRPAGELVGAIDSARDEVDRLQRLAEDLLLLAQAGEGRLPVDAEELPVAAVLEDVRDRFAATAARAGRSIEVEPVAGVVLADPQHLRQALTNLVDNALEHGAGVVRLTARPDGDRLALVVADQGAGFANDLLPRATERFVRSRGSTGAGLGLAIVAAVADAHHGSAGVGNVPGGAEAWISVPAVEVRSGEPIGA
ncbi:MAG TPA: ATP-binding protein [Nocardioides sp.]|jgi:two-component system OmpR family sensor kinase|nr:ATP-binding protein [Nocardioides sp.]